MTEQNECSCGYQGKDLTDSFRHITLMRERNSNENHTMDMTDFNQICKKCNFPQNEVDEYKNKNEIFICTECGNSRRVK